MFRTKRFGLFIHWGLYAIKGWHEQEQWRLCVDGSTYQAYSRQFNPGSFEPKAWVAMAKEAGMDYICFTTKHHDGFCMWDTLHSDYKVTNTPYGKDVLRELADACREAGLALSLYYSIPDWHHPNYPNFGGDHQLLQPKPGDKPDEEKYIAYVKNQVTELLTNYGEILSFFWDIPPAKQDPSVNALVRKLQPGILINNRGYDAGDFSTPERTVPDCGYFTSLTEACNSVGRQSWGYRANEDYYSHAHIIASVDKIMAMGGNYVLNVGPDREGRFPLQAVETLKAVGSWYQKVKPALIARPFAPNSVKREFLMTRSENTLYLHFPAGLEADGFIFQDLIQLPRKAWILNNGTVLRVDKDIMPTLCYGGRGGWEPVAHVRGIPVNNLHGETIVVAMEFSNLDAAFSISSEAKKEDRF